MKTIIFIGTNKSGSSREAVKAAEQLGYFTVVFTNNEKQLHQRKEYIDVHEMILVDTTKLSEMKAEIKKLRSRGMDIKTIVSFIDSYVHIASILCEEFCQSYISSNAISKMENKEETRVFLKNQPYTPKFAIIKPDELISFEKVSKKLNFPVMVKSPKSTGSKDALFAEDKEQLDKHTLRLREKNPDEAIIIEEYFDGDQYLVEALVYNNKILIAGILEQEITRGKRFIITGYGVMVNVPREIITGIERILHSVVSQFGIKNGPLHLEIRRNNKKDWKLIEINPRISGGAMNKMLQAAFGYNLVEGTLKLCLGEKPTLIPTCRNYVFTQYIVLSKSGILEKVTGKGRASKSPGVVEAYVKPRKGAKLTPPLSMGHRYAYVIAAGSSMEEAKKLAKNAANEIEFHLEAE
ncbi:ATP-grasp domain-containing protein [Bacillus sp. FJAT-29790]|uniref:ATP-grasp domain-containing protein n=1 Tax=Bacillus sp. FJAT-29790 TaxID=1895002 RepID=UPI001C24DF7B|nr:ATP-grasp domain-containing protein [Bacillus sp. FJAT-29790]MBU8879958.1 ATP-grasp domain-containing protein [Bacillus sp. FJAT-29790]